MGRMNINGMSYEGNSVRVVGDKVYIDNKEIPITDKRILFYVEGNIEKIECGSCDQIVVFGSTEEITTASGDVYVAEVKGSIKTLSGDVTVNGEVGGSVYTTSGDIEANAIKGSAKTLSGDIDKTFNRKNRITGHVYEPVSDPDKT